MTQTDDERAQATQWNPSGQTQWRKRRHKGSKMATQLHACEIGSITDTQVKRMAGTHGAKVIASFPAGSIAWLRHDGAPEPEGPKAEKGDRPRPRCSWQADSESGTLCHPSHPDVDGRTRHACMSNKSKVVWLLFSPVKVGPTEEALAGLANVLCGTGATHKTMSQSAPQWLGGTHARSPAQRHQAQAGTATTASAASFVCGPRCLHVQWATVNTPGAQDDGVRTQSHALSQAMKNDQTNGVGAQRPPFEWPAGQCAVLPPRIRGNGARMQRLDTRRRRVHVANGPCCM